MFKEGKEMRERASVIIVRDEQVLLIARWRDGRHYHVTVGGGVDPGETPRLAAVREALEETSLQVTLGPELWQQAIPTYGLYEHAFLVTDFMGEPKLGAGPEAARQTANNVYKLVWVPLQQVVDLVLYPGPLHVARIWQAMQNF